MGRTICNLWTLWTSVLSNPFAHLLFNNVCICWKERLTCLCGKTSLLEYWYWLKILLSWKLSVEPIHLILCDGNSGLLMQLFVCYTQKCIFINQWCTEVCTLFPHTQHLETCSLACLATFIKNLTAGILDKKVNTEQIAIISGRGGASQVITYTTIMILCLPGKLYSSQSPCTL